MKVTEQLNKINRQLMGKSYKLTMQREATVRVLLENESEQLSAEDVFLRVKEKHPEIGLATVYRTLELLAELHVVDKTVFGDGIARFDLRADDHEHMPHHLICAVCGRLEEIKDDWLLEMEARLEREYGFQVNDHRLDLIGAYHACKGKKCKRANRAVS